MSETEAVTPDPAVDIEGKVKVEEGKAGNSGGKRARTLDMAQQAKFWESEYKKIKALKMSGPETIMEVMKEEFQDMEKVLHEKINLLEEKLERQSDASGKIKKSAPTDAENEYKLLEKLKMKIKEQADIIEFYELFMSSKVKCVDGQKSFECSIENLAENKKTMFRVDRPKLESDKIFRAQACENPQFLPEYLHKEAIEFESSQFPYLLKETLIEMFKDDGDENNEDRKDPEQS